MRRSQAAHPFAGDLGKHRHPGQVCRSGQVTPGGFHVLEYRLIQRPLVVRVTVGVMVCVELAFTNDARRLAARGAHRRRLAELHQRGVLAAAGPWDDDSGALLIFRLDEPGARAEIDADPYYAAPGVRIVSIHAWTPVVGP
jgi:uncharacterized protein